jgi:hypothetical protein
VRRQFRHTDALGGFLHDVPNSLLPSSRDAGRALHVGANRAGGYGEEDLDILLLPPQHVGERFRRTGETRLAVF